jgi:hypothetical protein
MARRWSLRHPLGLNDSSYNVSPFIVRQWPVGIFGTVTDKPLYSIYIYILTASRLLLGDFEIRFGQEIATVNATKIHVF